MPSLQKLTLVTLLSTLALSSLAHPVASDNRRSLHPNSPKKRRCARPSKAVSPSLSLSSLTMPMATGTATLPGGEEDGMMSILPVGDLSTAISDAGDAPTPVGDGVPVETASASVIGNQLIRTGAWTGRRHRTRTTAASPAPTSSSNPTPASAPPIYPTPIPTTESVATSLTVPDDLETFPTIIPDEPTSSVNVPPGSSAVVSSGASVPAVTSAAPSTGGGGAGGKARAGLAINGESGSNWSAWTGGNVDWLYNWGSSKPANLPSSIEYVPMLWGTSTDSFIRDSSSFESWGVTSLLSFNEPDMGGDVGGSRIGAAEAARIHQKVFTKELNEKFRIGGPAVARGGKGWLQEFEAACGGNCLYDFLPIHYYGKDASQFAPYLQEMLAAGNNRPLWVTEVACIEFAETIYYCNEQENEAFMKQIIKDMNDPVNKVERHSWFGAFLNTASSGKAFGIMNTDGSPNALGNIYMTAA